MRVTRTDDAHPRPQHNDLDRRTSSPLPAEGEGAAQQRARATAPPGEPNSTPGRVGCAMVTVPGAKTCHSRFSLDLARRTGVAEGVEELVEGDAISHAGRVEMVDETTSHCLAGDPRDRDAGQMCEDAAVGRVSETRITPEMNGSRRMVASAPEAEIETGRADRNGRTCS